MAAQLPNYTQDNHQLTGVVLLVDAAGNPLLVTGRSLTNANAINVAIVDAAGNQITSFGGGGGALTPNTEYPDGSARGTATGIISLGDDGTNVQAIKVDANGVQAIQDNGGSITVDGTVTVNVGLTDAQLRASAVPVSGTFFQATQPVSIAVAVPVTDNAGSLTVDGTFWQATQPVSAAALPLPAGAATSALQTQPGVDIGDVTINNAGGAAAVNIQDGGNSVTVDGVFFQATQPISAAALPLPAGAATSALQTQPGVDIGDVTINNAAGASAVNVQDGGNSLTVDGTVSIGSAPTYGGKTLTYVPVSQGAAGTTVLAAADAAKKHKILGCVLTMSLAGTLKFLDSSGDLTGAMDIGATGGFVLPTSMLPYAETGAINRSISITTTTGLAKGVVIILTE